ncbi:hypothetical protein QOZ09_32555, partial [Pseudomonas aeruginosa]|uniref:hypothetical protein n=1 Tax=Pseudomonas aeruginosa TaxID=287 RepID=UPI003459285D
MSGHALAKWPVTIYRNDRSRWAEIRNQAGSHCSFRDRDEPLTRQLLSADEISVLECMALMEEEDRASFIRMAQGIADATVKRRS